MTYRLYRLAQPCDNIADGILLGSFPDFDEALAARDEDTVELFALTGPGELLSAHHQILGPGGQGPTTVHPVSSEIERGTPTCREEIVETRAWLRAIHQPT
jgi:hypothetical protein